MVGIGASAGGLEALEEFPAQVPPASGLADLVVQHLDPTQKAMLAQLLQRATPMPVREATERLRIAPHAVYVIPPNRALTLTGGMLHLTAPEQPRGLRRPIDELFESIASEQQEHAVGVVLSGMGADGTVGLKAIKATGGLATAHVNGMNVLAVSEAARDAVDRVRRTQAPFFLELHTYRFRAHSMFDAELYRDKAEVERWKAHGPIHTFTGRLKAAGMMTEADFEAIDREAAAEVEAAVQFAEAGSWEPEADLLRDVTAPH